MTKWLNNLRSSGSIAGILLIGLGTFLLYENAVGAVAAITRQGAIRIMPAILFSLTQFLQAYAAGEKHQIMKLAMEQTLLSMWPLILVIVGTLLARLP